MSNTHPKFANSAASHSQQQTEGGFDTNNCPAPALHVQAVLTVEPVLAVFELAGHGVQEAEPVADLYVPIAWKTNKRCGTGGPRRKFEDWRLDAIEDGACNRDSRIASRDRRQALKAPRIIRRNHGEHTRAPQNKQASNLPVKPSAHLQAVTAVDAADDTVFACAKRVQRKSTDQAYWVKTRRASQI